MAELKRYTEADIATEPVKQSGSLFQGLTQGFFKEAAARPFMGAGEIGRGIQKLLPQSMQGFGSVGNQGLFDKGSARNEQEMAKINDKSLPGEAAGGMIGTVASYLAPTSAVTKGQQILGRAAPRLANTGLGTTAESAVNAIGQAASRFLPEAAGTGAITGIRTGGDVEQIQQDGMLAGGMSVGLGVVGNLARKAWYPELNDSVAKALGIQGRKSGGQAMKELAQKATGFKVLKDYADDITVKTADGFEEAFDTSRATFETTVQAWDQTRKKVYEKYSNLAKQAGKNATVDVSDIIVKLQDTLNEPGLTQYRNATSRVLSDFQKSFPNPRNVSLEDAQKLIEQLNALTTKSFFSGVSDSATSQVNVGVAKQLRSLIDDAVESANLSDEGYQQLRSQYSALKSLESDLVRRFQQNARQIGGGLSDYMDIFSSGEIIAGIFSSNPTLIAQGTARGFLTTLRRMLTNPERYLQRSFQLIDKEPSFWDDVMLRVFGGNRQLNSTEQKAAGQLSDAMQNPGLGLSIQSTEGKGLRVVTYSKGGKTQTKKVPIDEVQEYTKLLENGGYTIDDIRPE